MPRFLLLSLLAILLAAHAFAQTPISQDPITVSDPQAIALATKSLSAMVAGVNVADITLSTSVTSVIGSTNQTGSGTFYAKGNNASLFTITLPDGNHSELRTVNNGVPSFRGKVADAAATDYAQHNAWTDSVWFFPVLSALSQTTNPAYIFSYVGEEQKNGLTVEHLRVFQKIPFDTNSGILSKLTTTDFYLDSISLLPLAIDFKQHPDSDLYTDLPAEILFANYQTVNGIQIPFHIARLINGTVTLDITVNSAIVNSGIPDSQFTLQ